MEDFFIYLIKSSGILGLFWCCFKLFLEKETLFKLHRVFLISGIVMALLFPLWTLVEIVLVDPIPFTLTESTTMESVPVNTPKFDWRNLVAILYACGVILFLGRLGIQLLSVWRLIKQGTIVNDNGFTFIESKARTSPFSFFNIIVYNPSLHQPDEMEKIIAHEKIHVLQWHSLDILLIHLFCAFQWVNPFAWLYKKSLSQNLEYLADQYVTKNMESSKEYQYLLLKNSSENSQYSSIINPFFNSSIKKRIVMLNKNRSNTLKAWKFSLVVPFLAYFLVAFNTKTITRLNIPTNVQESSIENGVTDTTKVEFTLDKNSTNKDTLAQLKDPKKEESPRQAKLSKETTKVEFIIKKTSTNKDLDKISNTLKNVYSVSQSFADIQRNQQGVIINISSSFTVSKTEMSSMTGTNTFNDLSGIKPFSIYIETDKENKIISMGHWSKEYDHMKGLKTYQKNKKTNNGFETNNIKASSTSNVSGPINPIYIVDGKEVEVASKATGIDPSNIHSINVLKGTSATTKYGEKAKDGAIEITTKANHNSLIAGENTANNQPNYIKSDKEPLFVIDGVIKDEDFDMGSIPPSSIESMNVLKDEAALNKYGKKGEKNGVVEITTKKSEWKAKSSSNINTVQPNANWTTTAKGSDESIADIKGEDVTTPNSKWKVSYGINMNDPDDILDLSSYRKQGMEKAVIFVNGVNKGKNYVPTMKYSEVEYISTYPPSTGITKRYGKLAKNGVIEIATKQN
ncbi:MAG: M56 family metallopeptidase [Arenibacter sp.]